MRPHLHHSEKDGEKGQYVPDAEISLCATTRGRCVCVCLVQLVSYVCPMYILLCVFDTAAALGATAVLLEDRSGLDYIDGVVLNSA